jgi:hypothetical protein
MILASKLKDNHYPGISTNKQSEKNHKIVRILLYLIRRYQYSSSYISNFYFGPENKKKTGL